MSAKRRAKDLPLWRKLFLAVVATVGFFVLLEAGLAVVGVAPVRYAADPYVGFSSTSPLFVESQAGAAGVVMETASDKLRLFNAQQFTRKKADGTTRVFCIGGSTTFGRPYDDGTSFCGWLRELLPVADPSRSWELINAGGVSYASYRAALLMEELIAYEPDLFIIYSGHNEFLERRTYSSIITMPEAVRGLGSLTAKTRIHTAVKAVVDKVRGTGQGEIRSADDLLDEEVTTLLDEAVGPSAYTRDDEQRQLVLQHYRYNLARMVDIARSVGAEAVLVTPASNLTDCSPFKSEHRDGLSAQDILTWEGHVKGVQAALRLKDSRQAMTELAAATAIDPRHAHLQYLGGQVFEVLGLYPEAKRAFESARDEDVCPLRALSEMPTLVAEVAADRQAPLVDFVAAVEASSPNGIAGESLFLDHVHPTIAGNRLLAETIVEQMAESGLVELDADWGDEAMARVAEQVEQGLDATAHGLALMKLSKVLGWAGKLQDSYRLAQQAANLMPDDVRVRYQAGLTADLLGRLDESIVHYQKAIEIQPDAALPHGNLGVAMEKKGNLPQAISHFRKAVQYGTPSALSRNRENLANALHHLGAVAVNEGRWREAIEALDEARSMIPGNIDLLIRLGVAQVAANDAGAAVVTFDRALSLRPQDPSLLNRRSIALYVAGRHDEAIQSYREALASDASIAETANSLEGYLRRFGKNAEADEVKAAAK